VRRTVAWICDEFAAAARREQRPGTARLILLDPDRFASATAIPGLSEFAEMRGMTDFSEAEQLEAYEGAYPKAAKGGEGGSIGEYKADDGSIAIDWLLSGRQRGAQPAGAGASRVG
jgi:hypothetical protein